MAFFMIRNSFEILNKKFVSQTKKRRSENLFFLSIFSSFVFLVYLD